MPQTPLGFEYEFVFPDKRKKTFSIRLDPHTLGLMAPSGKELPAWTRLDCCQCPNCPLTIKEHPFCPVAQNLFPVIEAFSCDISYHEVSVTIRTEPRDYQKTVPLQSALRSLFGIYMATSGCPVLDKLRPLVFTHLPFATTKETAYRAISMYVMAQFFIQRRGGKPDWELKDLEQIYKEVEIVNQAFHKRLSSTKIQDATLNAICSLNCYAQFTGMALSFDQLKELEALFSAYF
ncbi:MAG: hypothetical protein WCJ71_00420 [Candidatus Omnitrophota bacterium]